MFHMAMEQKTDEQHTLFFMSFREALFRAFGYVPSSPDTIKLEPDLWSLLEKMAAHEQRPLPELVHDLLHQAIADRHTAVANLTHWQDLTPREQQVAALACLNYTNQEIAAQLIISPNTVKTHMRNILYKCDLKSKAELSQLLAGWDFQNWLAAQDLPQQPDDDPTSASSTGASP